MAFDKERVNELLAQARTTENIEELIKLNEGLIGNQIKKFKLLGNPDALSLSYEALYNAILTYDSTKNSVFSTYATVCIYNCLGSLVRSMNTEANQNTISYDAPVGGEDGATHLDFMESPDTADKAVMEQCGVKQILSAVNQCYNEVKTPMHREIIRIWKEAAFRIKHSDIAKQVGCSQSYVNQVINKFRKSLKDKLEVM